MKKLSLLLLAVMSVLVVSAQQIEARLLKMNEPNATYVASFTETKKMPKLKKETVKKGMLYYKQPDGLSMRYTDPKGDYSIIKDGKFIVRRAGKQQKFTMSKDDSKEKSMMTILRNTLLLSLRGDVAGVAAENDAKWKAEETSTRFIFNLEKRKAPKVGVGSLQLIYDKNTGGLILLKLIEVNGNTVSYETSDGVPRQVIPEDVWEL